MLSCCKRASYTGHTCPEDLPAYGVLNTGRLYLLKSLQVTGSIASMCCRLKTVQVKLAHA